MHTVTFSNAKSIRDSDTNVYIDNIKVDTVKIPFIGVLLTGTLNWSVHIKYISSKLSKNIGVIKRLRLN